MVAKARQLGMDPEDIIAAGTEAGRPEWVAVGEFFEEYLDVLDAEQVVDYAELVHRSRILLADPEIAQRLRGEIDEVFVDEYQDTDPAQVRLLQVVAGEGRNLVVVGDPGPVGVRVPGRRGARHPRVRRSVPHGRRVLRHPSWRWGRPAGSGRHCLRRVGGSRPGSRCRDRCRREIRDTFRSPQSASGLPYGPGRGLHRTTRSARRPTRSPSCSGRPTCATGWPGTRWRCWSGPAEP